MRSGTPDGFCSIPSATGALARLACARLREHGKDVETLIVPGATHYFNEQEYGIALRKLFEFLRRHLNRS